MSQLSQIVISLPLILLRPDRSALFTEKWSAKKLVEFHQSTKPDLRVQDVCKLLYQANFGVEHVLTDAVSVRSYLMEELSAMDTTIQEEHCLSGYLPMARWFG